MDHNTLKIAVVAFMATFSIGLALVSPKQVKITAPAPIVRDADMIDNLRAAGYTIDETKFDAMIRQTARNQAR